MPVQFFLSDDTCYPGVATKVQETAQKYNRIFVEQFAWASDAAAIRDVHILGDEFRRYGYAVVSHKLHCALIGPQVLEKHSEQVQRDLADDGSTRGTLHDQLSHRYRNTTNSDLLILHYKGFAREEEGAPGTFFDLVPQRGCCTRRSARHRGCSVEMDLLLQHTRELPCHVLWILDCPFSENLDLSEPGVTILCAKTPRRSAAGAIQEPAIDRGVAPMVDMNFAEPRISNRTMHDLEPFGVEEGAVQSMTVALADILAKIADEGITNVISIEDVHDKLCALQRAGTLATKPILLETSWGKYRRPGRLFMSLHSLSSTLGPTSGVLGPYRARKAREAARIARGIQAVWWYSL